MSDNKVTYLEAISQAIREEMRRDDAVFLLGEDGDDSGGALRMSARLLAEFGAERVIDTPMSEAAVIGSAVGAALMGMRPVAEMNLIDFISCGFDQIIDMASKMYWRIDMPVPLVIRGASGGGMKESVMRTISPEAWLFHMPGVKVVTPSTVYDAKGMLKAAIRDDEPVLYLEHKLLYRMSDLREELPGEDYTVPLGKAIIRREGDDMTILTYGALVHQSLKAAQVLEEDDDIAAEVLDLRSLSPLDRDAILESVKRTNKALIVHENTFTGGIGSMLSALLTEGLFEYLEGPITQVATSDVFSPYASLLNEAYGSNAEIILAAARELAAY
jgi:pyruvate/2-oxoglutarate/acetoin dehydrogenase E1 component